MTQQTVPPRHPGVLVVDDDPTVLEMLRQALSRAGFAITAVASGPDAVAAYGRGGIDVVLLDVQMSGMDGAAVLDALRAADPAARVVMMTGNAGPYTEDELRRRGAAELVPKPFASLRDLAALLRRVG